MHRTLTIRDLRRNRSLAPGSDTWDAWLTTFLPLVYGSAIRLVPADAVLSVTRAVWVCFAREWRRLPRRTVVATWLLHTVGFAARRERRLPVPSPGSAEGASFALLRQLYRLRPHHTDAVVLRNVLRETETDSARALRCSTRKLDRWTQRGLARLRKRLSPRGNEVDLPTGLAGWVQPPPPEFESALRDSLRPWTRREARGSLVRGILLAWRWVELRRLARGLTMAGLRIVLIVALLIATVVGMARLGYLTPWMLRFANRQLVKELPELTQPARPWPDPAVETAAPAGDTPTTPAELYRLDRIWSARLTFTPDQWHALQPATIRPAFQQLGAGGRMDLRNPNAKRNGLAGVIGLEFNYIRARLEFAGLTFSNVAVRYRGNGTYVNSLFGPKQPFKVDLNKYTKRQHLARVHTLNFVNAIPDNSYLHDALAEQLFRDLGTPAPRTTFAYLTLEVPGEFGLRPLGLYVLIENLDSCFAAESLGGKDTPLFKPVTPDLFKDLGNDWRTYAPIYDLKTKATPAQLDRVLQFARLVTHADEAEFARRLPEFLDLEEFAAFLAGHVLLSSYDGFLHNGQNFFMYLDPRSLRFGFIPWDQDHAWGEFGYVGKADERERASIWEPSTYDFRFLKRVLKVEAFRAVYRRQLERGLAECFSTDRLYPQIDRLAALLRPAVAAESDFRLHRFDLAVSTNWIQGTRDGAPEGPKAPVHQIKRFIANRAQSVRSQLDGKAQGVVLRY